jgi:CBS domain-containing protein
MTSKTSTQKAARSTGRAKTRTASAPRPAGRPRAKDLMCTGVATCHMDDSLAAAARIMWERDCGFVPVIDASGKLCGVVTDRDACMASYTRGRSLLEIPVAVAMAARVVTLHADDTLERAHELMRTHRIRRLPVIDAQHRVLGVVTLKDLTAHALEQGPKGAAQAVAETLGAVSHARRPIAL